MKFLLFFILLPCFLTSKLPVFLGIFAKNYANERSRIVEFIVEELEFFPNANNYFSENPKDFLFNEYTFPPTFHITTLYIGGNETKTETTYYQEFKEGLEYTIKIEGVIIVPGKIITGITFAKEDSPVPIENEFAHMTLLLGEWKAVDSNSVMESVFGRNGPLKDYYYKEFFESPQPFYDEIKMNIKNEDVQVIVIKNVPGLEIDAITKKFF